VLSLELIDTSCSVAVAAARGSWRHPPLTPLAALCLAAPSSYTYGALNPGPHLHATAARVKLHSQTSADNGSLRRESHAGARFPPSPVQAEGGSGGAP